MHHIEALKCNKGEDPVRLIFAVGLGATGLDAGEPRPLLNSSQTARNDRTADGGPNIWMTSPSQCAGGSSIIDAGVRWKRPRVLERQNLSGHGPGGAAWEQFTEAARTGDLGYSSAVDEEDGRFYGF